MLKLLILDRDGVINYDSDAYIKSVAEWIPLPGSIEAIAQLSKAGWTVAIATNQSGIARGYYDIATLDAMHARLRTLVAEQGGEVGLVVYCPHGPDEGCDCRKPKPGMLKIIAEHYKVPLAGIWFVGDSLGDLEAAKAVDSQPVLVKTGKGEKTQAKNLPVGTLIFDDLAAVAAELINN
ncbi:MULTISPECIES: D-glycero-beta-D-manno-heptose 1,7-bisphosphate 7-phosphatase [Pseudomonas]|jgi:D-glycero-D-manno-heptose 1,7-bisphosphate phosphatase|uniref:D,D-heptose 1,7-bisphosphate phosphatase n=2 Tax=Pseudomonas TaxID=286 RepID=A0ABY0U563_9PSED|nr:MULTISPECIES: D-glycero-beta-D-manno-heptose 1,7-bisphosphate 7-phosphatase [Pseudomonas]MDQ0400840.1 D-glycero-D-manno-heptose 1,7-bisphosphate phosphatase [Pseudomonas sp. PvP006]SDS08533.1 D-alpha,beta-D-heptose 1,7-bisphosphate phosphatase [Pseudomonas trivialis]MBP1126980.1 D-glycero-D-manno-heptose 1,7-bisphosphate phosphatase [Pseudomonas sp. PvP025]WGT28936.1 D-glycero-beta-D-manno-heptose 1,7-bisphosphate 7-phosphatase [Pseudomonas marginalis]SAM30033.1 D,D-heptose 1,7-bisphosphate